MRYMLATCFVCTIGAPGALAVPAGLVTPLGAIVTPVASSAAASGRKADAAVKPIKHKLEPARHKTSRVPRNRSLGGIHPLVGSGDY
jgi:hypothetical protein